MSEIDFSESYTELQGTVAELREQLAKTQDIEAELMNGCNAMLGLIQLILGRDDITDELRKVLHAQKNHRIKEAEQAVAKAQKRE